MAKISAKEWLAKHPEVKKIEDLLKWDEEKLKYEFYYLTDDYYLIGIKLRAFDNYRTFNDAPKLIQNMWNFQFEMPLYLKGRFDKEQIKRHTERFGTIN